MAKSYYQMVAQAKKKYKKNNGHAQKGKKIKETRELRTRLLKQFPIGNFVSLKYCPKSIGMIAAEPVIKRHKFFSYEKKEFVDMLRATVPVLWMSGIEFAGETHAFPPDSLKKPNMKKVLETSKKV